MVELRVFTEPQQGASYDTLLAHAQLAEELGFAAWFRSDHFLAMGDTDGRPGPTDAWITLAGMARETSAIRLGTMVTSATFRHPGPLAIAVAQVDAMSGGRVELGLGAGWFDDEHRAYGVPFPPTADRFDRLEEQLAIVTGLWATPDGATFDHPGPVWPISGSPALPKPVQRPRPPVIVGGWGPKRTPALAARYADEFNVPFPPVDAVSSSIERVRAACSAIDRDPATIVFSVAQLCVVAEDEPALAKRAAAIGQTPEQLRENTMSGTVDEVVERLREYAATGVDRIYLNVHDVTDLELLRLQGEALLPVAASL
jgi:F420-dependent oxidoreductase-like protein